MSDPGENAPVILFADDEEVIRMMGRDILHVLGYEVILAKDGNEVIELYEQNRDKIALVLVDWHMPGMKGGEILERLWEINRDVKIILATGWGPPRELEQFRAQGREIGLLQKPFLVKDLKDEISAYLSK